MDRRWQPLHIWPLPMFSHLFRRDAFSCQTLLTAKLTLIIKSECSADEANATTAEEAEKLLEAGVDEEKKMDTDAAEDADNLVCRTGNVVTLQYCY